MSSVLLLSDIHANLSALEAVLIDTNNAGGSIDAAWVLGDSVGYGPQPNEVVDTLRSLPNLQIVKGNHEAAALGEISLSTFNPTAAAAALWTSNNLKPEIRDFLSALPILTQIGDVTLCHGTPRDPVWEYMFSVETARVNSFHLDGSGCIHGHTHLPTVFGKQHSGKWVSMLADNSETIKLEFQQWFANPGSVGQPRDGDRRASYARLYWHDGTDIPTIEYRRVEYDISYTQDLMLAAGLPPSLAFRLSHGR